MAKIIFNSRDELIVVNTDTVAVVQANGNYSRIVSINKRETMVTMGITQVENAIKNQKSRKHRFIRLGRSLIINHSFLQRIDLLKQQIVLSDGTDDIRVKVAKSTLKSYKEAIAQSIKIKNNGKTDSTGNGGQPAV